MMIGLWRITLGFVAGFAGLSTAEAEPRLTLISNEVVEDGVEILVYEPGSRSLIGVGGDAQFIYLLDDQGIPTLQWREVYSRSGAWKPTSVALDTAGRGFAAGSWAPTPVDAAEGMVQFIDVERRSLVWQLPVGEHPDCVAFTPDGRLLIVANEREPGIEDLPGGLTLVDLSRVHSIEDLRGLNEVTPIGFGPEHLADGVDLSVLRISADSAGDPLRDIEPEYLAATNDGVWVSLQENNALVYFDLHQRLWTRIIPLGTLRIAFDANDEDGIGIDAREGFAILHQPDTIKLVEYDDRPDLILLANEGEHDDDDIIRLRDAIDSGLIDPNALARLNALYGDVRQRFGRLRISTIDGDLDADGDIDVPTAIGGRGISLIDSQSGNEVWNSGSQMEQMTARLYPDLYNGGDTRSDRGGPEPEGLAVGRIGGRTLAFVGLERTDVIMMYDISDPAAPRLLATQRLESVCSSPEGLVFIDDGERWFLGVASEENGCLSIYEIHIGE